MADARSRESPILRPFAALRSFHPSGRPAAAPAQGDGGDAWLELFEEAIDERFAGAYAEFAKQRSRAIARRMLEVVAESRTPA